MKEIKEKNTRKLTRLGSSLVVSIPKEFLTDLKWREKQKVVVRKRGSKIIIEDWPASSKTKVSLTSRSRGGEKQTCRLY